MKQMYLIIILVCMAVATSSCRLGSAFDSAGRVQEQAEAAEQQTNSTAEASENNSEETSIGPIIYYLKPAG
ncbi:MAG: hypothetical protein ACYTDT_00790 [Planctomycetota bacterium]|jgi:hypothetical protein